MTSKIIICLLCLLALGNSYACYHEPDPFFAPPSYIDIENTDEEAPPFFHLLFNSSSNFPPQNAVDTNARTISQQQEKDNYEKYLMGAKKFNAQEYEEALKIFTQLKNDSQSFRKKLSALFNKKQYSWTKEAATYMIARCQLIMAQKNWNGYSSPLKSVDQTLLKTAALSYQLYLKEYPRGLYATSAQNISRYIAFLSGDQSALDQALKQVMLKTFPTASLPKTLYEADLLLEMENHFRGKIDITTDSPILITYSLLKNKTSKPQELVQLETRKKDFDVYPGLFRYLYTLTFYRLGQYQELLNHIPEEPLTKNILSLSTQLLRARAFSHLGKPNDALLAFEKMHVQSPEDAIELEIALIKLKNSEGLWLFSEESPIKTEKNLRSFAQFGLTEAQLEKGIALNQNKFLVDELALRYLLSKNFSKLTALLSKNEGSGIFIPIKSASAKLAKDSNNAEALMEVGEFIYKNYINPNSTFETGDSYTYPAQTLSKKCPDCSDFQERIKKYSPPVEFFKTVANLIQKSGQKNETEAKALHYLSICNCGNEIKMRCNWTRDSNANAQVAFNRLHSQYKHSPWAAKTPYYY